VGKEAMADVSRLQERVNDRRAKIAQAQYAMHEASLLQEREAVLRTRG